MAIKVNNILIGEGKPKICVPIVGTDEESILEAAHNIKETNCDLVEWRADWYKNVLDSDATIEVLERLKGILDVTPILFTIRTKNEGGELDISFEKYSEILMEVANSGLAELIDVEVYFSKEADKLIRKIQEDVIVIGSNHDFEKTEPVWKLCEKMQYIDDMGADILKLAVMPNSKADVINLLMATYETSQKTTKPIITMSMGRLGAVSRVCGETFGSAVTFGSVSKASAPGQIDVAMLSTIMDYI